MLYIAIETQEKIQIRMKKSLGNPSLLKGMLTPKASSISRHNKRHLHKKRIYKNKELTAHIDHILVSVVISSPKKILRCNSNILLVSRRGIYLPSRVFQMRNYTLQPLNLNQYFHHSLIHILLNLCKYHTHFNRKQSFLMDKVQVLVVK